VDVAAEILRVIKEVLMQRLSAYARTIRGYPLVTVIIGRDPFTDEIVPRSMENIIRGFMSLMDGGEEQFRQLQESGAIARTTARINAAVARLNMTPAYIVDLFVSLWNSFSLSDLAQPVEAFRRIMATFGEPIRRLVNFVIEIVKIVVEVILQIMNFPVDLIANIINRTIQAFELIKRDPVGFLKNLLAAIKRGFIQFFDNILRHLLNGVVGWLIGELRDAGVPVLTDFSLRGVIGWVLEVLGISMEKIWEKLAAHPRIGPERVARIRSMISRLEGIWTFIKDVQERGMAAIWDKIQEQLSNLWDTVLDAVKNWIMEKIITAVVTKLLSMLDPTGIMAVINSAIAIYRAIQSFIRYITQMLQVVNSFVEGVVEIAQGSIARAANALEAAMDRAMPIVIGFLANQVGLGGVGRRVAEMIERVREMVDRALTWLVNRAVDTGAALLDRVVAAGRSVGQAVLGWLGLRKSFRTRRGESHSLYFDPSSRRLTIATTPVPFSNFISTIRIPANRTDLQGRKTQGTAYLGEVENLMANTTMPEDQKTARMQILLEEVGAIALDLMEASGGTVRQSTPPQFAGTFGSFGRGMRVEITGQPATTGSDASATSTEWLTLVQRRELRAGGRSLFVRGHLLSQSLGGDGADMRNLTPLTQTANQQHEQRVELNLKHPVETNQDRTFLYVVTPNYGRQRNSTLINQVLASSNPNKTTIANIIDAEQYVPASLICSIRELDPLTGQETTSEFSTQYTIQNSFPNTTVSDYIL